MTDQEIIKGLIDRDNRITEQFFFAKCRPLLTSIMRTVFDSRINYDEMVNEFYRYLMDNDGEKLRQFQFRSSIYQWMKVVALRFFIRKRDSLIENGSSESTCDGAGTNETIDAERATSARIDVAGLLGMMENRRYADVIKRLVLDDAEPAPYAMEIGVTVDNLYNIKKRAMTAFSLLAIKYYGYGT